MVATGGGEGDFPDGGETREEAWEKRDALLRESACAQLTAKIFTEVSILFS